MYCVDVIVSEGQIRCVRCEFVMCA